MTIVLSDFFSLASGFFGSIFGLSLSAGVTISSFIVSAFVILTVTGLFFRFKK